MTVEGACEQLCGGTLSVVVSRAEGCVGSPLLKPGNRLHVAQNGHKPWPEHCGSGVERAQRLGSAALGIIGKAAGHSILYPPDHDLPSVPRRPSRIRNPCTDLEWSSLCCIWLALNAEVPLPRRSFAAALHASRMHSRFLCKHPGN